MAAAGSGTYDTGGETVYTAGQGCTSFFVHVTSTSSNPGQVNIAGMHGTAYVTIRAGHTLVFRRSHRGIKTVILRGSGGDAIMDWGVVAKDG